MTFLFEYEIDTLLDLEYEEIMGRVMKESLEFTKCPYEVEISILLTDNEGIKKINQEFRNVDAPTDVLSFPMADYDEPGDFSEMEDSKDEYFNPDTGELMLGDIIISVDKVLEQAEKYGHSKERELAFLTAHSMLHLVGYDHMVEEERRIMEQKQEDILQLLGIVR